MPGLKIICVCAGTGLALSLAVGCSKAPVAKAAAPVPVLTAKAVAKTMPVLVEPPPVGHVLPILSVTIRPQIGGVISTVNFREGQEVKKGDLLFTIDPRPAQAQLARDRAQLKNAEIQFDREQKLFADKLISQDEFDTSKSVRDTLVATVQSDELNLGYCEIRSPIDGRTGGVQFHEGNVVKSPDDVLLTINPIHQVYAAFAVPERFFPEIQKQMGRRTLTVTASYENLQGEPPSGELSFVDNAMDAMTGTILLKATFTNADGKLWPGQFVQLSLQLDELTDAVVVPSQAVQSGQNGPFIFVVKEDKTVEQRAVKPSVTVKGETAIAYGLRTGEIVVTDGQLRLAPGVTVNDKGEVASTNSIGK